MDVLPPVFCQNKLCPQVTRFHGEPRFIGAFLGRARCDRCGKWTEAETDIEQDAGGSVARVFTAMRLVDRERVPA